MSITIEPKEKDEEDKNISHLRIPFSKPALTCHTNAILFLYAFSASKYEQDPNIQQILFTQFRILNVETIMWKQQGTGQILSKKNSLPNLGGYHFHIKRTNRCILKMKT